MWLVRCLCRLPGTRAAGLRGPWFCLDCVRLPSFGPQRHLWLIPCLCRSPGTGAAGLGAGPHGRGTPPAAENPDLALRDRQPACGSRRGASLRHPGHQGSCMSRWKPPNKANKGASCLAAHKASWQLLQGWQHQGCSWLCRVEMEVFSRLLQPCFGTGLPAACSEQAWTQQHGSGLLWPHRNPAGGAVRDWRMTDHAAGCSQACSGRSAALEGSLLRC